MLRGGAFRVAVRVLPLALVLGLFGISQADTAGALGPAILLSITVTPAVTTVTQGSTQQFTATGLYSDLSTKNLTDTVTWATSSAATATVSNLHGSQGLATGVGTGLATITAADGLVSGTGALTVTPTIPTDPTTTSTTTTTAPTDPIPTIPIPTIPTIPATLVSITVTPPVADVAAGAGEQFSATGTYSDLSTRDLTDSVTWSSSDGTTATISNAPGSQGLATGVATGAVTITAADTSALVSGVAALTVTPVSLPITPSLIAIAVTPPAADVAVGAGEQFTATGTYSDLSTRDLTDSVTWSSSDGTTATISNTPGSQGLATGVATGAVTVTAADSSALVSGVAALTVTSVSLPIAPPSTPNLALTPSSGKKKAPVLARGSDFAPGTQVVVTYLSGLKAKKRASTVLCRAVAASNGTFQCRGNIPRARRSGKQGNHTVEAVGGKGGKVASTFTLVRR
jgi:trimeric autotransporter adhesin